MSTKKKPIVQDTPEAAEQVDVTPAPEGHVYIYQDGLEDADFNGLTPTVALVEVVGETAEGNLRLKSCDNHVFERHKDFVALTKEGAVGALRRDIQRKRDLLDSALHAGCDVLSIGRDGELEDDIPGL